MNDKPTFTKVLKAFSTSLGQIPQDDLPEDIFKKATKILDGMREDPDNPLFQREKGKQILPGESNLSLGFLFAWQGEWGKKNPTKSLFIDMHLGAEDIPDKTLDEVMDYEIEREQYVVVRMATFLRDQKQDIPDPLRDYLGLPRPGSGEVK